MSIQPWRPTEVLTPQAEKELWNILVSYCGQPLKIPDTEASFVFKVISPPEDKKKCLHVQTALIEFLVYFDFFPFKTLFEVDFDISQMTSLPTELREAICRSVLSLLWTLVPNQQEIGAFTFRDSGDFSDISANMPPLTWLSFQIMGVTNEPILAGIGIPLVAFLTHLMHGKLAPQKIWPALEEKLFYDVHYTLGSLDISFEELSHLKPGDMMVFDDLATQEVRLRVGETLYRCALEEEAMLCTHVEFLRRSRAK